MNIRQCEYLLAIEKCHTLSAAAKHLGISQPTLSNFLHQTERELQHTLFTRQNKSLYPTSAGRIYLDACQRIAEVKNRTYQSILALSDSFSEHFTVGVTPHRGSTLFSQIYADFYRRHPDVHVELKEGYIRNLIELLDKGELDMVMGAATDNDMERFGFIRCSIEELYLCVPDFHPLAALAEPAGSPMASIDIERFADTPFVMWGDGTTNRQIINQLFLDHDMIPTTVYESNNVVLLDTMISSGIGIGFLPVSYCLPGKNRAYFSVNPPVSSSIGIYYQKGATLTRSQRFFIYLIVANCLLENTPTPPALNEEAYQILNEFKER